MYQIVNPYTLNPVESIRFTSFEDCSRAIDKLNWKANYQRSAAERARVLNRLADLLEKNSPDLVRAISLEMGKTIKDGNVELERSVLSARIAASELAALKHQVLDSDSYGSVKNERLAIVKRVPLGNILAVTPFNFPINLALHKIAPAFAMGNACLLKPHPQCYLSTSKLVALCYEAGFLESDLQLIIPDVPVFQEIIASPNFACISFTGGTATAQAISKIAGVKKQLYELGGNDALIVMPDGDYQKAAQIAIAQRFTCAGQRCTASKRIFVHESLKANFIAVLAGLTSKLKVGDPLQPDTDVGPLVHQQAAEFVWQRIQNSLAQGARVVAGNKRENNLIYPTILDDVTIDHELVSEETFGPVLPIIDFQETEQVIQMVNSSQLGLQCGVFTNDLDVAKRMFNEIETGAVIINNGPAFRIDHFPFGGMKQSGIGREGIPFTMEEMSVAKTLII